MGGVDNLAAEDAAVLMEGDDEGAAELAEGGVEVRFFVLGMILFREDEDDARLIAKRFPPGGRDICNFRLFAVPFEYARDGGLDVGGRAGLFHDGRRERFPSPEQRHVKTRVN